SPVVGNSAGSPAACSRSLVSRSAMSRVSASRSTICRLGRDRPVSRNEMCRAVEPTCPARLSWLSPRRWRHCRSRAPNGLAWRVTGASMAAAPPYHDSLPGNRLAGGWPPTLVGMAELSTDLVVAAPADRVWEVIGRRFDRIGDWATAVPHSTALPDAAAGIAGSTLPIVAAALDAPVP